MAVKRRHFLLFLGAGAGTLALTPLVPNGQQPSRGLWGEPANAQSAGNLLFRPIQGPMPLATDGFDQSKQLNDYSQFTVVDDLVLPEGYTYQVIASWGDPVGNSRFGYNNDYVSFVETAPGEGFLTVNFEYISSLTWLETYELVIGRSLPIAEVKAGIEAAGEGGLNAYDLPEGDSLKAQVITLSKEALIDQGLGIISLRRTENGTWERTFSNADRRVTGISGLEDGNYLKVTGPAAAVFQKSGGQGYVDDLGDRIIGTFGNCAGGTTPWGTILSAEENYQAQVPEPVHADGTSFAPSERTLVVGDEDIEGQGNVLGLAGNKYGWIVEIDPANANDYGTKHSWLGRYRHEAVGIRVEAGQPIAFYSGCDRRGGHVYKFVSTETVSDPTDKANSRLLADGMLYAAKFNPDGTGRWIALEPGTAVDPDLPSTIVGGMVPLPLRPNGGFFKADSDEAVQAFKQQFRTLGDLYTGTPEEQQGAILIDAHFAANAAGATLTARPEDTMINQDGSLYIAFTSGTPGGDGGPDARIFVGPKGETEYEYGFIMRLVEDGADPAALSFRWEMLALGGEPADGGFGFSNPDNFDIDANGNLWMVTDMSTSRHNKAVPSRVDAEGNPVKQTDLLGLFGNNSIWYMPLSGRDAGEAYLFGYGPMECETTGPFFTKDQRSLFLAVQHPGERNGTRKDMTAETRQYAMRTTDGQEFMQTREVPIGSNWPGKAANNPPKPSVVVITRLDGERLT